MVDSRINRSIQDPVDSAYSVDSTETVKSTCLTAQSTCLTAQVPAELVAHARRRAQERYCTVSQYLRDLIVRDRDTATTAPAPAMTEDDGKLISTAKLRSMRRRGGAK